MFSCTWAFQKCPQTRFSSPLCKKAHGFCEKIKQCKCFLLLPTPQKCIYFIYWIFYSALKTIACFWITKLNPWEDYRPVWWLSLPVTGLPSHVPFEPIEKCEMKFRLVSSNSRGTSINKRTRTFLPEIEVILKVEFSFILLLTHEACFQSRPRTVR